LLFGRRYFRLLKSFLLGRPVLPPRATLKNASVGPATKFMKYFLLLLPLFLSFCAKTDSPTSGNTVKTPSTWTLDIQPASTNCLYACVGPCQYDTVSLPLNCVVSAIDTVADSLPEIFVTGFEHGIYRSDTLGFFCYVNNLTDTAISVDGFTVEILLCDSVYQTFTFSDNYVGGGVKRRFQKLYSPPVSDTTFLLLAKFSTPRFSGHFSISDSEWKPCPPGLPGMP